MFQDTNGELLADTSKLSLLEQVEDYGYLCYNFLNDLDQKDVNELLNCNLLTSYNSFMSKQENDLFNFVFNNKFSNTTLGIRNLYMHGILLLMRTSMKVITLSLWQWWLS